MGDTAQRTQGLQVRHAKGGILDDIAAEGRGDGAKRTGADSCSAARSPRGGATRCVGVLVAARCSNAQSLHWRGSSVFFVMVFVKRVIVSGAGSLPLRAERLYDSLAVRGDRRVVRRTMYRYVLVLFRVTACRPRGA